jgi:hypothetical protein
MKKKLAEAQMYVDLLSRCLGTVVGKMCINTHTHTHKHTHTHTNTHTHTQTHTHTCSTRRQANTHIADRYSYGLVTEICFMTGTHKIQMKTTPQIDARNLATKPSQIMLHVRCSLGRKPENPFFLLDNIRCVSFHFPLPSFVFVEKPKTI